MHNCTGTFLKEGLGLQTLKCTAGTYPVGVGIPHCRGREGVCVCARVCVLVLGAGGFSAKG